jgi:7,8-dihydropterin-6-yl-methyl-4-(beta-D-ribofuranosyl)aminobenzene 5'-phosphate synthase
MARQIVSKMAAIIALAAAISASEASAQSSTGQITVLYDAFGKTSTMTKDWGFAALVEYGGKRILFDTGNNAEIFAHNVETKGIDLRQLDFVIVSHRHGDHTSGLNHLLKVNPAVKIYAPQENFGVFGAALPSTFYKRNESLPADMRYFDGKPPDTLRFGTPWPEANFTWITKTTEVAPGFHLILLNGTWGADLEVKEISLAIDTPDGIVLIVGCSHPTIEKIVEAAKNTINKPIHLVLGGTHLLPAKDDQISSIAVSLRDKWGVRYLAPVHCTGEPAFAILKETFSDHYVYAGLGTTVLLGPSYGESGSGRAQQRRDGRRRLAELSRCYGAWPAAGATRGSLSSHCKLSRYRINKVTSSAGNARDQMIRAWLFARYGMIGLAVNDVPGVRA